MSVAKARASASICCSPPDSVPAICLRRPLSCGNCEKATSSIRSIGTPTWVAIRRFSRTLRLGKMPRPSGTVQMPLRARSSADILVTTVPSKRTSPPLGVRVPAQTLSSVVFPPPFGPSNAITDPAATSRLTPWTTSTGP